MSAKIVFFLAVFCIAGVQINNAGKAGGILDDLQATINLLGININLSITNSNTLLANALALINSLVDNATSTVNGLLGNLADIVAAASNTANGLGIDISSCINAEAAAVAALNVSALEDCRVTDLLDGVPASIGILENLLTNILGIIPGCLLQIFNIINCINLAINNVQNILTGTTQGINDTIDNAQDVATACVDSTVTVLNGTISDITESFQTCVAALLS